MKNPASSKVNPIAMAPNPNPPRRSRLVMAMHDVWPGNFAQVDREIQWLSARGVPAPALLVVPHYHGERRLAGDPAFLEWLRAQIDRGSLLFAHGYRHQRAELYGERVSRSVFGRWVNHRVQHEGEFAGLSPADTAALLRLAFDAFLQARLEPAGFAFPAWIGGIPKELVWPTGCRFLDSRFHISDLRSGRKRWAPPLTFGRESGTQRIFMYGGAAWLRYLRGRAWIRIALHPGDLESPFVRATVEKCLESGDPASYDQVFGS